MELTTKGRYAVMAMADLARHCAGAAGSTAGPAVAASVPLSAISERQEISLAYLEQIFGALRRAGLVTSIRGRSGGYQLARAPGEISINAIMSAVDEGMAMIRCDGEGQGGCVGEERCHTHELWTALGRNIASFLSNVTLKDLLDGVTASDICNAHSIAECAKFAARQSAPRQDDKTAAASSGAALTAAEWTIK